MPDDKSIITLFQERSEQAIAQLSEKYGKACNALAFSILGDREDAEECVNDAYLALWNTIPPVQPDPLVTYAMKIVRNLSLKLYHKKTAAKRSSAYTVAMEEIEPCLPSADTVERQIEAKELSGYIESFLDGLPTDDRVIFMRRYWFCDSYAEIAKHVCISEKNVSVKLTRLRRKMKQYLIENEVSI